MPVASIRKGIALYKVLPNEPVCSLVILIATITPSDDRLISGASHSGKYRQLHFCRAKNTDRVFYGAAGSLIFVTFLKE
jgi:hypothetical protein